jgi:hypothetical protein
MWTNLFGGMFGKINILAFISQNHEDSSIIIF